MIVRRWSTGEAGNTLKTSDRAFIAAAAATWNQLPQKVNTATTTQLFSHILKTHNLDWSRGSPPVPLRSQWRHNTSTTID